RKMQFGPGGGGTEDIKDGKVEMERWMRRDPIVGCEVEIRRGPVDEIRYARVSDWNSLRYTRRAGSVHDVSGIIICALVVNGLLGEPDDIIATENIRVSIGKRASAFERRCFESDPC